jgi:hypothetical protein
MHTKVGDIVTMTIIKETGYAVWGEAGGKIGFIHCFEFANERPIPDECIPRVGDVVRARVIHVPDSPVTSEPLDVTCGGTITVDFGATMIDVAPAV